MKRTFAHRAYAPIKRYAPAPVANFIRSALTAFGAPLWQASRSGHIKSAFAQMAVDRRGDPVPWFSYPCVHLLQASDLTGRRVLEFGSGQSTLWWARHASSVLAFDDNPEWAERVATHLRPPNAVHLVPPEWGRARNQVQEAVGSNDFDIVVIDGMERSSLLPYAADRLRIDGCIVFDNSRWLGIVDAAAGLDLQRVDFFGPAPGVSLPQCTSIFFRNRCFLFDSSREVAELA